MQDLEKQVFEHLNQVSCGEVAHLQVITATKPIRLKTRLIGIDPNMSVILKMGNDASWEKAADHIKESKHVVVRLLSNDQQARILAFRSTIQKIMSTSGNWLVLDYPKAIESASLRKHVRIPISIEASLLDKALNTLITPGHLTDLSLQGCAFSTANDPESNLKVDHEYRLLISLEESDEVSSVELPVVVKNVQVSAADAQYGLVFKQPEQDLLQQIQQLLLHHLQQK